MLRRAAILGGAAGVEDDHHHLAEMIDRYRLGFGEWELIAVNDAIAKFPVIHQAVTLHPEKLDAWMAARAGFKHRDVATWTHPRGSADFNLEEVWPAGGGHGSSGLFAVKVALALRFNRIVLCGVPMDLRGHFFDARPWRERDRYADVWSKNAAALRLHVRSMSGWTRELLGAPTPEWLTDDAGRVGPGNT